MNYIVQPQKIKGDQFVMGDGIIQKGQNLKR